MLSDLFLHNNAPLILEVEINVGSLSEDIQGMDTHALLSNNGYRLIDLRKTYDFPEISNQLPYSAPLSSFCILSSFPGRTPSVWRFVCSYKSFESTDTYTNIKAIYCLCMYRQFHLATRIIEYGITDIRLKDICLNF